MSHFVQRAPTRIFLFGFSRGAHVRVDMGNRPNKAWGDFEEFLWGCGYHYENRVLTLPQWCAFLLPRIVHEFNPSL